ncbi:MAG: hypothetical protein OXC10_20130 [Rhodospirillaceae bacterium]|nr:hypothetical protein [Rhodospirillaceae bacterium]
MEPAGAMNNLLARDEIISLIEQIYRLDGTSDETGEIERKTDNLIDTLEAGVLDPEIVNYMYWEIPSLTPEQIADRALAYKPIILPDESQP